jgi:hypothetical protein
MSSCVAAAAKDMQKPLYTPTVGGSSIARGTSQGASELIQYPDLINALGA